MKPGVAMSIGILAIAGKQMPMHMWFGVSVAGMVHLPGVKGLDDRGCRYHYLLKQLDLNGRNEFMQLPDVLFKQNKRVAWIKLMITNDKNGVLKLLNKVGILSSLAS
jgi:hypothetical protein